MCIGIRRTTLLAERFSLVWYVLVVRVVGLFSVPERNVFYPAEKYKNKSKPLSSKVLKNLNDNSS